MGQFLLVMMINFLYMYEQLIDEAKRSFLREEELEKIFFDAIDNQRFDDWQWAVRECYLQLKK